MLTSRRGRERERKGERRRERARKIDRGAVGKEVEG
jgi:hypothetical protein